MKTYTKLRSWMSREEIERYLDEQDELEMEERKIRKQKTYSDREEMLNEMWLESYDVRRDEHYEIEFEENCREDLD